MIRRKNHTHSPTVLGDLTVRLAGPGDAQALARLAALDSATPPAGPTVVAEIGGELVAAQPLVGGAAIADPFRRTAAIVELLGLRARQLRLGSAAPETGFEVGRFRVPGRHTRPMPQLP